MFRMSWVVLLGGSLLTGGQAFAGDAAAGKAKSESCVACHGEDGKEGDKPIVGLAEADFIKDMRDYQSGAKQNKKMLKATKGLTDDDIANLAAYYSGMK